MRGIPRYPVAPLVALVAALVRPALAAPPEPSAATAEVRRVVRLGADAWCPYNCEPGSAEPGFVVEIARAAFARRGWETRYEKLPWSRAIADGRHGQLDGIIGAVKEDAPDFVFPASATGNSVNVFYVKGGDPWRYAGIPSLDGVMVGVIRDYSYGPVLDEYLRAPPARAHVELVSGDDPLEQNVAKLLAGRVRVLVENGDVMRHFLRSSERSAKVAEAGSMGRDPLYVAFSPSPRVADAGELARALDEGLAALRTSGELAKILARYGVADWEQPRP